ncbi:MAG TPA: DUF5980 family protein [Acidimicrobiia bacterium]|jgi:hypothetical protein|nr:DUF5980 family protein [Acidimicrobiia bacterium]
MTRAPIRTGLVLAALLASFWPAAAASAHTTRRASWHVIDHHERACVDDNVNPALFPVYIAGTWSHALRLRVVGLPNNADDARNPVIAAGSSNGRAPVGDARALLRADTPTGTYEGRLVITDGTISEHMSLELRVKGPGRCGY